MCGFKRLLDSNNKSLLSFILVFSVTDFKCKTFPEVTCMSHTDNWPSILGNPVSFKASDEGFFVLELLPCWAGLFVVRQSCALQDVINTVSLLTDCRASLPHNCKTRNYP